MEGVDYAFTSVNEQQLAAAGKRFVMRYVGPGSAPKHLTPAELARITAAGLGLVLLAEGADNGALGGFWTGRDHAVSAAAAAAALGLPALPIYYAVDFDCTAAQWATVREYLRGAASGSSPDRVGVYGSDNVMAWAARDGVAQWFFQTFAWSGGAWFAGNHVEQYRNGVPLAGGTVDLCRSKQVDFGQYPSPGGDTDMTPAQEVLLFNASSIVGNLAAGADSAPTKVYPTGVPNVTDLRPFYKRIAAEVAKNPAATPPPAAPSAAEIAVAVADEEAKRMAE